jgi:hypothetical protein
MISSYRAYSISDRLLNASPEQRANYEVSPFGYGIHWPDIEEDLAIDPLPGITHHPPQQILTTTDPTN